MIRNILSLLVLCLVAFAAVQASERSFVEHNQPIAVPSGWKRLTATPLAIIAGQTERHVNLMFALKQRNLDVLEETFWAVSTPSNARYGKHLNLEELNALIAPEEEKVRVVIDWLRAEGFLNIRTTNGGEFIKASAPVSTVARVFQVQFHRYKHEYGLIAEASLGPYTVPAKISKHLELITGVVGFPDVHHKRPRFPKGPADVAITPDVIRARYNITDTIQKPNPNNMRAVAEFQAEYYSASDLKSFWSKFVTNAPDQDIAKVVGTNIPNDPGDEASLDVQYIMGVVPNISTWFYSLKSDAFWNDLLVWTAEIANETAPPQVHSVSYGSQGDYPSVAYRERLNTEFQKAGVRGISIIFASGDSGSGCSPTFKEASCKCELYPSFPATCPYITSIGATAFISENTGAEKAVMRASIGYKSGGGFSKEFPVTAEQKDQVDAYLSSGVTLPPACSFNASNRATPDASALGDIHFQIVQDGSVESIGGTSASAPTFASIISLLNEQRLNAGKSTLGFLNPWIYQTAATNPTAFFDVTSGDNVVGACCGTGQLGGFKTAPGWDPATGVGTPNYQELVKTI